MVSAAWVEELYRLRLDVALAESACVRCRMRYYEQTKRLEALEP